MNQEKIKRFRNLCESLFPKKLVKKSWKQTLKKLRKGEKE
jgi:hypothetical protein